MRTWISRTRDKDLSFVTIDIMAETMWMRAVFKAISAQGLCFLTEM